MRNGPRALECATRACELSEWSVPGFVDSLAAAHAELGQFNEAIRWQEKAVSLAADPEESADYETRLELYRDRGVAGEWETGGERPGPDECLFEESPTGNGWQ